MPNRSIFILTFLALLSLRGISQIKSVISHYGTSDGLSDSRVRCIIKDSEGFMWIGTWAGINRFDGHNFVSFKASPGDHSELRNNRINQIVDGGPPFLWVTAYDNQVYRFDKSTQQFLSLSTLLNDNKLNDIRFSAILYADSNAVWLESEDHGLFLIHHPARRPTTYTQFSAGMTYANSLPANKILFSKKDRQQNLWVSTTEGLCLLTLQPDGSYRRNRLTLPLPLTCTGFAENDDHYYLSTKEGYLLVIHRNTLSCEPISIAGGPLNDVLLSRQTGLLYFSTASGAVISFSPATLVINFRQQVSDLPVHTLYEDKRGVLWIEPEKNGVIRYAPAEQLVNHFKQQNYANYLRASKDYAVWEDNQGIVWVYMKGCGFGYYDNKKGILEYFHNNPADPGRRFSNMITTWYYDTTGVLWLSTEDWGLEKIVFQQNDFRQTLLAEDTKHSPQNGVRGLLTDHADRCWIGTKAGHLFITDKDHLLQNVFENPLALKHGVYCMMEDRHQQVWLGTKSDGLYKAQPLNKTYTRYRLSHYGAHTTAVYSLLEDSKGRIWAGTYGDGLLLINTSTTQQSFTPVQHIFRNYPEGNFSKVRCLQEDKWGNVWVGTTEGLLIFHPDQAATGNRFKVYKKQPGETKSIGGNDIQYIFRDVTDTMWICTSSGGISKAITSNPLQDIRFDNYSVRNGLSGDYVLSCVADNDQNIWLTTQSGISKLNRQTHKIQNFGLYDGLSNVFFSEASCTRLSTGAIIFGSNEGYWSFMPQQIGTRKINAPLAFTNIQVNNRDILPADSLLTTYSHGLQELRLPHDQNTITIDFAVLDYRLGEREDYLYRLKGFDRSWKVSKGQRRITYTSLPPGHYRFEVKSQTEYLYLNTPERSLPITILAPIWKTPGAYVIYFLLTAIVLFIIVRTGTTLLQLKQRITVERKLTDLRQDYLSQVSHELRTPLTLIIHPAEEILRKEQLSTQGAAFMQDALKNTSRMVHFVNRLLNLRKTESGSANLRLSNIAMLPFLDNIIHHFRETIRKRHISITVSTDVPEPVISADADKLDTVLYNLLGNAIKFSPDHSDINIEMTTDDKKTLCLKIVDNRKDNEALSAGEVTDGLPLQKDTVTDHDREFLERIIHIVDEKMSDSDFNLDDVADAIAMSRSAFYKKFKSLTNTAPVEFVRETRLNKARQLFDAGEENISGVAYTVGFSNPKYFSTCFKNRFGQTPSEYLRSPEKDTGNS
ncbi:AraC family transcriptional regulator [Chitinophaga rhizophila]|uniref:histidine kinase n=1 Tax=Chitinophaga rhizophila TaxID=2866212 RepID=A0ABS7GBH0_9BACT|nr:two-component regulator propeller domain-containing protein [Chitinophaga rhizophila]MBW8684676.1 helix-turn-helix domain-containing protein [Chitinophaga rhizophila]